MSRSPPQLRIAAPLGIGAAIATACMVPYLLALKPDALGMSPIPPALAIIVSSLQTGILCFLLAWAGLKLGAPLGLGAPWLGAWLYRRPRPLTSSWLSAAAFGALAAIVILGATALFGMPHVDAVIYTPAAWKGLLATPYGGIVEEVLLRVFAMGSVAWLLARASAGEPRAWVMVIAIAIAAVLFGAGHLPLAAQLGPLTVAIVTRVIAYNAIAGVVFGAIYWKRGLEHAMLAHFCADLVLHVAAPLANA